MMSRVLYETVIVLVMVVVLVLGLLQWVMDTQLVTPLPLN